MSFEFNISSKIAVTLAIRIFGLFMVYPIIMSDLQTNKGINDTFLLGLVLGIYGLTQAILQIPLGLLSDKLGRKKVIIGGLIVFFIGSLLAAIVENIYWLIFARALQGCGAISAVALALLSDKVSEEKRIRAMAMVGMSIGFAFIGSLILGPLIYSYIGLKGLFYFIALTSLVGIWLIATIQEETKTTQPLNRSNTFAILAKKPSLMYYDLLVFTIHACMTAIFLFIPVLLIQFEFSASNHWSVYLITISLSMFLVIPLILFAEKKGQLRLVMQISLILLLTMFLFINLLDNWFYLIILMTLFFAGFNILEALLPAMVSFDTTKENRGTVMGIYSSCQFLGAFIGGAVSGFIIEYFSYNASHRFFMLLLLLCFLLSWFVSIKKTSVVIH